MFGLWIQIFVGFSVIIWTNRLILSQKVTLEEWQIQRCIMSLASQVEILDLSLKKQTYSYEKILVTLTTSPTTINPIQILEHLSEVKNIINHQYQLAWNDFYGPRTMEWYYKRIKSAPIQPNVELEIMHETIVNWLTEKFDKEVLVLDQAKQKTERFSCQEYNLLKNQIQYIYLNIILAEIKALFTFIVFEAHDTFMDTQVRLDKINRTCDGHRMRLQNYVTSAINLGQNIPKSFNPCEMSLIIPVNYKILKQLETIYAKNWLGIGAWKKFVIRERHYDAI